MISSMCLCADRTTIEFCIKEKHASKREGEIKTFFRQMKAKKIHQQQKHTKEISQVGIKWS